MTSSEEPPRVLPEHAPPGMAALGLGVGQVVGGKYLLERLLGQGGMGVVVAARHFQLGHRVALKFLLPEAAKEPEAVERFLREAQTASELVGEHVTRVIDLGTHESGAPFMVMELLEGHDLAAELSARGPLPMTEAVDLLLQALEAIAEAHLRGFVHRDLKPANLFLTRRPDGTPLVKVLDFGLSKNVSLDRQGQSLTRSSTGALGSPLYMAPEQVRSVKNASFQSDLWSIGVLLYELLTNEAPFFSESLSGLLAAIIADPPKPLGAANPSLPAELELVVMRCLEKTPAARWPDVGSLAVALEPFGSPLGRASVQRIVALYAASGAVLPRGGPPPSAAGAAFASSAATSTRRIGESGGNQRAGLSHWNVTTDRGSRRRKQGVLLLAAAAGVLLASAAWFVSRRVGEAPPAAPAAGPTEAVPDPPLPPSPEVAPAAEASDPSSAPDAREGPDATPSAAPAAVDPTAASAAPSASVPATPTGRPPAKRGTAPTSKPRSPKGSSGAGGTPSIEDLVKEGRR